MKENDLKRPKIQTGFAERMSSVSLCLLAAGLALVVAGCRTTDPLSLWNDGAPAKKALIEYVAAVTDSSSPDFIPVQDRIAVFDLDGTLLCETAPSYFFWQLFEHRVLDDKSFTPDENQRTSARNARAKGICPGLTEDRGRMVSAAYRGMTPERFDEYVHAFMEEPQPGFSGMKRGEAFYRPMVEVVEFLVQNGFTVYVISGSNRLIVRALVKRSLPLLPARQLIGSDSGFAASGQGDTHPLDYTFSKGDKAILSGRFLSQCIQMNKVSAIVREIGDKPLLSFGNSMTDASMCNYVISDPPGGGRRAPLAFMLLCDDTTREYGNPEKAEKMRKACAENGWIPVSMRDDWKTIYGDNVSKTQLPTYAH